MYTRETLLIHSVETFLTTEECAWILRRLDRDAGFAPDTRQKLDSVHKLEGLPDLETAKIYQPEGRREDQRLPGIVIGRLDRASARALPSLRLVFPSAGRISTWFYAEYGADQYITPHVDYPCQAHGQALDKLGVISVCLSAPESGGEFYVETANDPKLWRDGVRRRGLNGADAAFMQATRTRWTVAPRIGDAIVWGSEMIHGTNPVKRGVSRKLLGIIS